MTKMTYISLDIKTENSLKLCCFLSVTIFKLCVTFSIFYGLAKLSDLANILLIHWLPKYFSAIQVFYLLKLLLNQLMMTLVSY